MLLTREFISVQPVLLSDFRFERLSGKGTAYFLEVVWPVNEPFKVALQDEYASCRTPLLHV